jgi:hypothetical protein
MIDARMAEAFRLGSLTLAAVLSLASSSVTVEAQNRRPSERLQAMSVNMSNAGRAAPSRIEMVIERWSSDREPIATLEDKGSGAGRLRLHPRRHPLRW